MEPSRLSHTDLYEFCRGWSQPRTGSFQRWELDDITHEAFLCAILLLEHHVPNLAKFTTYLDACLYDCVRRNYNHLHDVKVTREKLPSGKQGTRQYWTRTTPLEVYHNNLEIDRPQEGLDPARCPERYRELAYLLARGIQKQAIAYERGVTASAIAHQIAHLRRWYLETLAES